MSKKAIIVVSFGTSYPETCAKTIGKIEEEIREKYPEYDVYRAWTSGMIRSKIEKRDRIHIFSISEVMEQLNKKGVKEIVIQPTHIVSGIETDNILKTIELHKQFFTEISVGTPLLTTQNDCEKIADMLIHEWNVSEDEMLVFMGHGTDSYADFVYTVLNDLFQMKGHRNMIVGTVKGSPTIDEVLDVVKKFNPEKVILTPFMIVAGDHANNELAGEQEDSWKSIFEKEGYKVECVLKGLGEYEFIRRIFQEHLEEAMLK